MSDPSAAEQPPRVSLDPERARLAQTRVDKVRWDLWGPYLAERQWGTVREAYSPDGQAWPAVPHEQARSRAYRGGEDGLLGVSDDQQRLCFALALWNGQDPILKERLFGLTNGEANHGEDVKEYYFYLDSTPTHSYMKWLYKYPHRAFPYKDLVTTNRLRSRTDFEYELIDTGVFDGDDYFDVQVEYAKAAPEDILIRITATNRGHEPAMLHVLPTLWFRNTWRTQPSSMHPKLEKQARPPAGPQVIVARHDELGERFLYLENDAPLLFTDNETNTERLFGRPNASPFVKDGINDFVVHGRTGAVNPAQKGSKAAVHEHATIKPGGTAVWRLRLSDIPPDTTIDPFAMFDRIFEARRREADAFYEALVPPSASADEARVVRQALSGMLWSKQYYFLDAVKWLSEHGEQPFSSSTHSTVRNAQWAHMINADVISM